MDSALIAQQAESAVVGLVMHSEKLWQNAIADNLTERHFADPANRELWQLFCRRHAKGYPITLTTIREAMAANRMEHATVETLSLALEAIETASNWSSLVGILNDRLARRIAAEAAGKAHVANGNEMVAILKQAAEDAANVLTGDSYLKNAQQAVAEFMRSLFDRTQSKTLPGIETGLPVLDDVSGGFRPGQFWVFAGTPGRGKTALMLQVTASAVFSGKRVAVFSLEMGTDEIVARILANHCDVPMPEIMGQRPFVKGSLMQLERGRDALKETDFHCCDRGGMTIDQIEAYAWRLHDQRPLDLVVIDYIQLVEVGERVKGQSREQEVAQISRRMKRLAKSLRCPVISGSQLNDDGNVRESRAIKQDADALLKILAANAGIEIDKLRCGRSGGILPYGFDGDFQQFTTERHVRQANMSYEG